MFGPQKPYPKVLLWYFGRLGYKDRLQTYYYHLDTKVSHLSTHKNWTEGYPVFSFHHKNWPISNWCSWCRQLMRSWSCPAFSQGSIHHRREKKLTEDEGKTERLEGFSFVWWKKSWKAKRKRKIISNQFCRKYMGKLFDTLSNHLKLFFGGKLNKARGDQDVDLT